MPIKLQRLKRQRGFSLIELVIVIVISGVLASIMSVFITRPVEGYINLTRRATLVYTAENALRRMQRDIRRALPNSLRVRDNAGNRDDVTCTTGTICALEMISTFDGGRYQRLLPGNNLDFTLSPDVSFDTLGNFEYALANGILSAQYVSIYNIGAVDAVGVPIAGANAYAAANASGTNVITPADASIALNASANQVVMTFAATVFNGFAFESPRQRVYLVDAPISYECIGGNLNRHTGYALAPAQPLTPTASPALMADSISRCRFTYEAGTSARAGVITMELTVTDPLTSESVSLLHQVHVDNVP